MAMIKSRKNIFKTIILPLLLVILLPLFIWVVSTQRFEVRKKAASGEAPTSNSIAWMTQYASLTADNFYIRIGKSNYTSTKNQLTLHSDPGNPKYRSLEAIWHEFNPELNDTVEMRMFIYFKSDGVYWWSDEIRTYNGNKQGDWIYYKPVSAEKPFFKTLNGRPFIMKGDMHISSTPIGVGTITFRNLKIYPFFEAYCFDSVMQSGTSNNATITKDGVALSPEQIESYQRWVELGRPILPGCQPCIPFPILDKDCSMGIGNDCSEQIRLQLEPDRYYCSPFPTISPATSCTGRKNGTPCSEFVCPVCPPGGKCIMLACSMKYGNCIDQKCVIPLTTTVIPNPTRMPPEACPLLVPPAPGSNCKIYYPKCIPEKPCCPYIVCPTITKPPLITPIVTRYITPIKTPIPSIINHSQTISITFKFASVPDNRADKAKVKVGIVTPTTQFWTQPLEAKYLTSGATGRYIVTFTLPSALTPGQLYRFMLKGEKHIASKICRQVGQTKVCGTNEWITVPDTYNYGIDYTGRPLDPGDVPPQDNITDVNDFNRIKTIVAKPSSQQTVTDKYTGDLNYDGVVNTFDILLMRKSLETRPDEN